MENDLSEVPFDKLTKIYRKIKEHMDTLTQAYDTQLEELKAQQEQIKFALKDQMKANGQTSVKTSFGTVSLVTKTRYTGLGLIQTLCR